MDTKNIKGCNYRLIGYPESMHPHVIDKLKEMGVPFAVSTLHDRDRFDSDQYDEDNTLVHRAGDIKKAHYHFFIKFAGGTTWKTVHDRIAEPYGLVLDQNPSKCLAFSEAIALRYFLHLDDPDKFQYGLSELDSCFFYGYDQKKLEEIFSSNSYRVSYLLDLKRLIYAYDILFVNQLIDYLELTKSFDVIEFVSFTGRHAVRDLIKDRAIQIYGEYKPSEGKRAEYVQRKGITPIEDILRELEENNLSS